MQAMLRTGSDFEILRYLENRCCKSVKLFYFCAFFHGIAEIRRTVHLYARTGNYIHDSKIKKIYKEISKILRTCVHAYIDPAVCMKKHPQHEDAFSCCFLVLEGEPVRYVSRELTTATYSCSVG